MRPETGLALRMAGPLIEVICLILLFRPDRPRTVLGLPTDPLLYAGLLLGFTMVVLGLTMVRRDRRRPMTDDD